MKPCYIFVKVETDDPFAVVLALDAALDGDDIYKRVGRTLVCDINSPEVQEVLNTGELNSSIVECRNSGERRITDQVVLNHFDRSRKE